MDLSFFCPFCWVEPFRWQTFRFFFFAICDNTQRFLSIMTRRLNLKVFNPQLTWSWIGLFWILRIRNGVGINQKASDFSLHSLQSKRLHLKLSQPLYFRLFYDFYHRGTIHLIKFLRDISNFQDCNNKRRALVLASYNLLFIVSGW